MSATDGEMILEGSDVVMGPWLNTVVKAGVASVVEVEVWCFEDLGLGLDFVTNRPTTYIWIKIKTKSEQRKTRPTNPFLVPGSDS